MLANRMLMNGKKTYDSFTKSLLHFNGTWDDEIGKPWIARGTGVGMGTSKFGAKSIYFDGGAWIDTPDHADFALGSGDFTFDFWIKRGSVNAVRQYIFGQVDNAISNVSTSIWCYFDVGNSIGVVVTYGGTQKSFLSATTITDVTTWHHLAIVRNGATLSLYIDGVFSGSTDLAGNVLNDSTNLFSIGRIGEYTSNYLNGYIDEFRFSKGIARWTANFTPPTKEY
jgi:hypothetical protein